VTSMPREIAILGGGLAGLSLAVELVRARVGARITIVDPRQAYEDDRTWCFWDVIDHPYRAAASHCWNQLRVTTDAGVTHVRCSRYPYCRLSGHAFYETAVSYLQDADNVVLALGRRVDSVTRHGSSLLISTDMGAIHADLAFDGRPPTSTDWSMTKGPVFWQTFTGWRVHTDDPVWSTEAVELMDFRDRPCPHAIGFAYILPLTRHEALVESTAFMPSTGTATPDHEAHLQRILRAEIDDRNYEVTACENGRIPMADKPPPRHEHGWVVPIGTRAGAPRPSSGYAFLPIQRHSQRLAKQLAAGRSPGARMRHRTIRWLDGIFLRQLRRDPRRAPALFQELFERVPAERLVRFLTETGSLRDHRAVMAAMPVTRFAGEALLGAWRPLPRPR